MCLQTRSGMIQALTGVAYPFVLAPVSSFLFATRHFTYRLPSLTEKPKEVLQLWSKFTKSASTLGVSLLAFNILVAMLVAGRQMSELQNIANELRELEKKIDAGLIKVK